MHSPSAVAPVRRLLVVAGANKERVLGQVARDLQADGDSVLDATLEEAASRFKDSRTLDGLKLIVVGEELNGNRRALIEVIEGLRTAGWDGFVVLTSESVEGELVKDPAGQPFLDRMAVLSR